MALDNPFRMLARHWMTVIQQSAQHKKEEFQDMADEGMKFYSGTYEFLFKRDGYSGRGFQYIGTQQTPGPSFAVTMNKVAEMVQIFGPLLYERNPIRQVNPRKVPMVPIEVFGDANDPQVQATYVPMFQEVQHTRQIDKTRAGLIEYYLNYTPNATNLKEASRNAIDEALIKGAGVLWTSVYTPPGAEFKMTYNEQDTINNLFVDPDTKSLANAKWIARKCIHPVWEVARMYGIPPDKLKGNAYSTSRGPVAGAIKSETVGKTADLLVYYKLYSKMGMGNRLKLAPVNPMPEEDFEQYGDYAFLAVCDSCDHPLNLPPEIAQDPQAVAKAIEWETPFWADDAWPCSVISFHWVPDRLWPMSHLQPALGELKFLNWAYGFLMAKIRTASRDFIAVLKAAGEEIKNTLLKGTDYEIIEIEKAYGTINEVVQFLKHPDFNGDIYKVIEAVTHNFELRTGMTELMFGVSARQDRSAAESNIKSTQTNIRPDDMANKVEDWMAEVARRETLTARYHLQPEDVEPIMGKVGAYFWQQFVWSADIQEIMYQLEMRVEAGSARKPNKDRTADNMQKAMQNVLPILMQSGQLPAVNALLSDWARSIDLDPDNYFVKPLMDQMAAQQAAGQPQVAPPPSGQPGPPTGPPPPPPRGMPPPPPPPMQPAMAAAPSTNGAY